MSLTHRQFSPQGSDVNRPTVDEAVEMLDYDGNFDIEEFRRVLNADVESDEEEQDEYSDEMDRD